jgi:hypothetical protein
LFQDITLQALAECPFFVNVHEYYSILTLKSQLHNNK